MVDRMLFVCLLYPPNSPHLTHLGLGSFARSSGSNQHPSVNRSVSKVGPVGDGTVACCILAGHLSGNRGGHCVISGGDSSRCGHCIVGGGSRRRWFQRISRGHVLLLLGGRLVLALLFAGLRLLLERKGVRQVDGQKRLGQLDPTRTNTVHEPSRGQPERKRWGTHWWNFALSVSITTIQSAWAVKLRRGAQPMQCLLSSWTSSGSKTWQPGLMVILML